MLKILQRLPFAPVTALLMGCAVGVLALAMPLWMLEYYVGRIGLSDLLAAAQPPLGMKARILAVISVAFSGAFSVYVPLWFLSRIFKPSPRFVIVAPLQRQASSTQMPDGLTDASGDYIDIVSRVRRLPKFLAPVEDASPTLPSETTYGAAPAEEELILAPAMAIEAPADVPVPLEPVTEPKRALLAIVSDDAPATPAAAPIYMPQPDPVLIIEPAPVPPPEAPVAAKGHPMRRPHLVEPRDPTFGELVDRFEKGLSGLRHQTRPPGADGVALRAALGDLDRLAAMPGR